MAMIINLDKTITHQTATSHPEQFGEDGMTLEAMQALVGGFIEHVGLRPPFVCSGVTYTHLVINEVGKLEHLPANRVATDIVQEHGLQGDVIVGVAILLTDEELL